MKQRRLMLAWLGLALLAALVAAVGPERSASASLAVADVALAKQDSVDPVPAGGELTYTLTVTNSGPDRARGVRVSDPLPAGVTFLSASSSQGSCSQAGGRVDCTLGPVLRNSSASVTIRVRAPGSGTLTNTATVSTTVSSDPTPQNNSATATTTVAGSAAKPNIVVVMTDDQAALDGREIAQMSNVTDIFTQHGVTFADFHSETPLCCPARANTFSGQHTHNHRVTANNAGLFDPKMTVATQLRSAGYHTFLVGKYMNQYGTCNRTDNCAPTVPAGWDRWAAFGSPGYRDYDLWVDGSRVLYGSTEAEYSTDVLAERTVSLIRSAPAGKPIFAWIGANAPHSPTTPAPRHQGVPCPAGKWEPPSWNEADVSDKPAWVQAKPLVKSVGRVGICRTLLAVDDLVGRVRDELVATGRYSNTLFIYMGDNGMVFGEHRLERKSAPYQTQIPFLASWPGRLGTNPRTVDERVQNIDLAPTLCELGGCTLGPYPNGQAKPDGISFASLLLGNASALPRDAVLDELPVSNDGVPAWYALTTTGQSTHAAEGCAVAATRGCRWHYIEYPATGETELYDLSNGPCWAWSPGAPGDPCELNNEAGNANRAALVAKLRDRLAALKAERGTG